MIDKVSYYLIVVIFSLCVGADVNAKASANDKSRIEYFGFFASSATKSEGGGQVDSSLELRDLVNLVWIGSNSKALEKRLSSVASINADRGAEDQIKVIVNLIRLIYYPRYTGLRENYQDNLHNTFQQLSEYSDMVIGYYIADEAFYKTSRFERDLLGDIFETVNFIKDVQPEKELWLSVSHLSVENIASYYNLFKNIDMLAVTCYGPFDRCGYKTDKRSIPAWYETAMKAVPDNVSFFLLPKAFVKRKNTQPVTKDEQLVLVENIMKSYDYAQSNGRLKAFVPFLWQDYMTRNHKNREYMYITGTKNMPYVYNTLKIISHKVLTGDR